MAASKGPIIWQEDSAKMLNSGALEFKDGTKIYENAGDPNGTLTASSGSLVLDTTNKKLWLNNSSSNGTEWKDSEAINDQIRGPSGFLSQDTISLSYDSNTLKLTIGSTAGAVFKGDTIPALVNGWESLAHETNNGTYYQYFDGTNYTWSTNGFGSFDNVQIGIAYKDASVQFGLVEAHGCAMDSDDHRNQHFGVGTQRLDGGLLSQIVVNSTTAANRRPYVDQTRVLDEDKLTTLPALSTNSYTQVWLTGTIDAGTNEGTLTWATSAADIVNVTTTRPNVNILTSGTGVLTPMTSGNFMSVWLLTVPVTADTNSQQFRYIWVQGQTQTTTAAAQLSIDSRTLDTRKLARAIPESVFIQQVVLEYVGGGTNNWRINSTRLLTGSRVNQISVSGASGLSSVNSDSNYFTGLGTPASQLGISSNVMTIDTVQTVAAAKTFSGGIKLPGTAPAAGFLGESTAITEVTITTAAGAWRGSGAALTLTTGEWEIIAYARQAGAGLTANIAVTIATNNNNDSSGSIIAGTTWETFAPATEGSSGLAWQRGLSAIPYTATGNITFYAKAYASAGSNNVIVGVRARRVG